MDGWMVGSLKEKSVQQIHEHNCLSNTLQDAPDLVNSMNSELICPGHYGQLSCHHKLISFWQTSRHKRLLICSSDSRGGARSSVRASGKDQRLRLGQKKKALSVKSATDQSLPPAKVWNGMTPPTSSTLGVGGVIQLVWLWPSPFWRAVYEKMTGMEDRVSGIHFFKGRFLVIYKWKLEDSSMVSLVIWYHW